MRPGSGLAVAMGGLSLPGCVPVGDDDGLRPSPGREQDNPQLALLDHVLGEYVLREEAGVVTICAAVHDGREEVALTPAEEDVLLARYARLAPLAQCSLGREGWRDADSGAAARVFTLHSFACASASRCSGWAGSAGSMSYRYAMDWDGARWTFARDSRLIAQ